ncbi:MAG: DUF4252 domain-containing protein [Bryobacteraceae bacterium]
MKRMIALIAFSLLPLSAQEIKIPESLDKLAAKAKETVNISLDGALMQLAGNFLSGRKADEAKVKQLTAGLKGLHVRVFEFAEEGQYTDDDLAPLRAQLATSRGWSRIVDVAEKHERTEVYTKTDADRIVGVALVAAERRELTVVYVDGPIDLKRLSELVDLNLDVALGKAAKK